MCYNNLCTFVPTLGMIAVSRAGHDKGCVYGVVSVLDADFVLCADGDTRQLSRAKKKRFKHLKPLGISAELSIQILDGTVNDERIKRLIREYPVTEKLFKNSFVKTDETKQS